jgi:hypothetical protein
MKQRTYHYVTGTVATGYKYQTVKVDSEDKYDNEIVTLAFHIGELAHADKILPMFGLRADTPYFYEQCRSVISVSESHQNAAGEGKFNFQAYFHNFPESVIHINDSAIVVVSLEPKGEKDAKGLQDYWLVGYIHVNVFEFRTMDGALREGLYYNMLRISERSEGGVKVYRRKKIFTMVFSILHSLVDVYGAHFAYAAMGKENQAIYDALVLNAAKYGKHVETFPVKTNTMINRLYGSKSASAKLVDISRDTARLKEMYKLLVLQKKDYLFNGIHSEDVFLKLIASIFKYSKTSKVFMIPDAQGNISAACIALNWGDYFALTLENPKGLFKFLASLQLTDQLLYPIHVVGNVADVPTLLKGIAYYYRQNHKVKISIINSYDADPYAKAKSSLIYDNYVFFIITDELDTYNKEKTRSLSADGVPRYFIDHPIL